MKTDMKTLANVNVFWDKKTLNVRGLFRGAPEEGQGVLGLRRQGFVHLATDLKQKN